MKEPHPDLAHLGYLASRYMPINISNPDRVYIPRPLLRLPGVQQQLDARLLPDIFRRFCVPMAGPTIIYRSPKATSALCAKESSSFPYTAISIERI